MPSLEKKMSKNNDTVCISCAFAEWDDITQTGCSLKTLDKFRERGAEVLDCFNDTYEFNVIKDRQCPNKRSKQWKNKFGDHYQLALKEEKALHFAAVVFADGNLTDLRRTVVNLSVQYLLPHHIVVVNKFGSMIRPKEITNLMTEMDFPWRLDNQLQAFTIEQSLSSIVRATEKACSHVAVFFAGDAPSLSLLDQVNRFTTEELFLFGAIVPNIENLDYCSNIIIPHSVFKYWYFEGNRDNTVLQNMKEWEKDNHKLLFTTEEVKNAVGE